MAPPTAEAVDADFGDWIVGFGAAVTSAAVVAVGNVVSALSLAKVNSAALDAEAYTDTTVLVVVYVDVVTVVDVRK